MKKIVLSLYALLLFLASCKEAPIAITDAEDYDRYLLEQQPDTTSKYFKLWNSKITEDSIHYIGFAKVASEYNRYFKGTGDIAYLKKAEQALTKAVSIAKLNKAVYRQALARNYISQHRFKEALQLAEEANTISGGNTATKSLLFDVHMELGNYDQAEKYLDDIKNMSRFGFLIRIAKWSDYKGDLDSAIRFMEKALVRAEASNDPSLISWAYTNLADFYGHAGRINESYQYYLRALAINPKDAYAKKGIAWIVYSHEHNGEEALRILNSVTDYNDSPDYELLKAEVAEFLGKEEAKAAYLQAYSEKASKMGWGDMYNTYTIELYAEEGSKQKEALRLAQREVNNRPTPETYGLLAHSYLALGKGEKALEIVEQHVAGKTYEPAIQLNIAKIYKATGQMEKMEVLKDELAGALYELGPMVKDDIARL